MGTIHSFQGREADIVIFDLVVDQPHWRNNLFITDEEANKELRKMFNVAITRARFKLFVIGNYEFCKKKANNNALSEFLGKLTEKYKIEIKKIHKRLNNHMKMRGSHQKMAFHMYYKHFGLKEPFDLKKGYSHGIIRSGKKYYEYRTKLDAYDLTHEIFIPYEYGDKLDAEYFSKKEKEYIKHVLKRLTVFYIMKNDPDLTAELVSCIRYLKMTELPVYREAIEYLLNSQKNDGKWGNYEKYRKKYGKYVNQAFYLHTTAVVIDALTVSFHYPEHELESM